MGKISKITFVIPSLGEGGAERVVSNLSNNLALRGYEVSVIMISHKKISYPINESIKIENLNCDADNCLPFLKRYKLRVNKIKEAVKKLSPDVVVSFMSETNIDVCFALKGLNIPIVVSERNDPKVDPNSKVKQFLRKIAYKRANGFVFQTPDAKSYFSKAIQKRSTIILNPLTAKLPESFKEERDKRIVAVGRLNKQKNFPLLIDAFSLFNKENSEYVLEIYGAGVLERSILNYIKERKLEDKVILKGFCTNVHECINSASMFVMSSDFEGMPNALLEALALGIPCISTDCPCGGPRLLIENYKNGILVPVGGVNEMASAMRYITENPEKAKQMGETASKIKEKVEINSITEEWLDFINKCCGV